MPILPLTARSVAALRAPSDCPRVEYFDADVPGLTLRVTSDAVKTWSLVYRHHGRKRRFTIGRFPDTGLGEARRRAVQERGRIVAGADPATEKQDERATDGDTVGALYEEFKKVSQKKRSWPEQRRIFESEVLPAWKHLRVQDLTRREIRRLVENKVTTAPVMANRMLARISRLFSFAVERDWIEANPALRIAKPGAERSRDRVLTRGELRELWPALHETTATDAEGKPLPRLSATLNDAFLVMLLTAQRCGEVCRMRWADVDLVTGWWTVPAETSKNGDPHRVPLTDATLRILKARVGGDDVYVFSNHRHTSVAARAKKAASTLSPGLTFTFRAHDLRRTAASFMGEAGVDRMHIAHVLNHRSVTHSTVTAIYDRYRYDKEKRAALQLWVNVLARIVSKRLTGDAAVKGKVRRSRVKRGLAAPPQRSVRPPSGRRRPVGRQRHRAESDPGTN